MIFPLRVTPVTTSIIAIILTVSILKIGGVAVFVVTSGNPIPQFGSNIFGAISSSIVNHVQSTL